MASAKINKTTYSYLPFRASIKDRDAIHIHHITRTTGNMMVTTENSESLPFRSFQLDHECGYNRLILNGPTNGRAKDKDSECVNQHLVGEGMGFHFRTFGSKFESANELYYSYGKPSSTSVDSLPCTAKKPTDLPEHSYFTMYGGGNKKFERFYHRKVHTVVYGEYKTYVSNTLEFSSKKRLSLFSVNKNCNVKNDIRDSSNHFEDSPPSPKIGNGSGHLNQKAATGMDDVLATYLPFLPNAIDSDHSVDMYADGNISLFGRNSTLVGGNSSTIVTANGSVLIKAPFIFLDGIVVCSRQPTVAPIDLSLFPRPKLKNLTLPEVGLTKGYDEYPDSHKAIYEDVWRTEEERKIPETGDEEITRPGSG